MSFGDIITRGDTTALMPEDYVAEIIQALPQTSVAMALFRHVIMSRAQTRMPAMAAFPSAYWVNGDTGLKQTSDMSWSNKYLNAEEVACIVPIPEVVLNDAAFDIWSEVQPWITMAVGYALDAAVFLGSNKPASWPTAIGPAAEAAGNVYTAGTNTAAEGGIVGDISDLMALVEEDGYDVNGVIANRRYKGLLRQARGTTGEQLGAADPGTEVEAAPSGLYGVSVNYPLRGLWPTGDGAYEAIVGDFSEGLLGVRQDMTWKVLDQAVIQDNTGVIQYNLAQQDMVALRVVARFGFEVAQTLQPENIANAYPFGVMKASATGSPLTRGSRDRELEEGPAGQPGVEPKALTGQRRAGEREIVDGIEGADPAGPGSHGPQHPTRSTSSRSSKG